jgi:phytoene desaturase
MKKGVVIGGGMAGLVTASVLSARGYEITLLEKQATLGGKLQSYQLGDYSFDFGPTAITMPWIFERVYREAGKTVDPDLEFIHLPINSRNFFADGDVIDLTSNPDYMAEQLERFSPEDRGGFIEYIQEIHRLYAFVEEYLLDKPIFTWKDFLSKEFLRSCWELRPFGTLDEFHRQFFYDPHLIAVFNRSVFTFTGTSPYETPAVMAFLSYLDLVQGIHYVRGGNYRLIESFAKLAEEVGVNIYTNTSVDGIVVEQGKVQAVIAKGESIPADFVVSTVDQLTTREELLHPERKRKSAFSSDLSAFLCLWGVEKTFPHLSHHNHFIPEDYGREFVDWFDQGEWSLSPSIYVCYSGATEPERAGNGSNLYALVYVPSEKLRDQEKQYELYRTFLVHWLEEKWGLSGLDAFIEEERIFGPEEIAKMTGSWNGRIFTAKARKWRGIFETPFSDPKVKGLYYAGCTTQGCSGLSMAAVSGLQVAGVIERESGGRMIPVFYR